jgi:tetratricopeptide (TPR) repeat protein
MPGISSRPLIRSSAIFIVLLISALSLNGSDAPKSDAPRPGMPTDPKALKTYQNAIDWLRSGKRAEAIDSFRKAARQDGHCTECLRQAYSLATSIGQYKEAEEIAREWLGIATSDFDRAAAHYRIAIALQQQGINDKKDKCFDESCGEFKTALQLEPKLTNIHYAMGVSLAHMHQDDAARTEFSTFLSTDTLSGTLIASILRAPAWRHHFPLPQWMASKSRSTASPARSYSSTSGLHGAVRVARLCPTFAISPIDSRNSRSSLSASASIKTKRNGKTSSQRIR